MSIAKALFGIMRITFVILTPACVLLGVAIASWMAKPIDTIHLILVFVGAIAAHICVNSFNEYFDFKSGLDEKTIKTPFSGGSGTLPANPGLEHTALIVSWVSFFIVAAIGLYFCLVWNWSFLPLGLLGLFLLYAYTKWFTHNPILCLIAPGLGFGVLMVNGTYFALTGGYSLSVLLASIIPFFLVSNLLLLNQFPDAEQDCIVGRKHLPIIVGKRMSAIIYNLFLLGCYLDIAIGTALGYLPPWSMLGLATAILAIPAGISAFRDRDDVGKLIPAMGMNVLINIITPILVSIGLFVS